MKTLSFRSLPGPLLSILALATAAATAPAMAFDDAALARQAYAKIILPGYAAFDETSGQLVGKVDALCSNPSADALAGARAAARETLLAFGRIEPIRFGPIAQTQRLDRLLFYPDAHGIVSKQTAKLLSKADEADIDPAKLTGSSVAVQGFGALDAALFGAASDVLASGGADTAFRCHYAKALAVDIAQIAADTHREWAGDYGRTWLSAGAPGNKTYLSNKETTQALYRAYVTHLEIILGQRLSALGGAQAKPTGPLLPHSGLGLAFVMSGIQGEHALLGDGGFTAGNLAQTEKERNAVAMLGSAATDLDFAVRAGEAAAAGGHADFFDPQTRERLTPMLLALKNAEDVGRSALGDLTGLTLGFNSLDGD